MIIWSFPLSLQKQKAFYLMNKNFHCTFSRGVLSPGLPRALEPKIGSQCPIFVLWALEGKIHTPAPRGLFLRTPAPRGHWSQKSALNAQFLFENCLKWATDVMSAFQCPVFEKSLGIRRQNPAVMPARSKQMPYPTKNPARGNRCNIPQIPYPTKKSRRAGLSMKQLKQSKHWKFPSCGTFIYHTILTNTNYK